MPPTKKLTKEQIADLTQWVRIGAPWPTSDQPAPFTEQEFQISPSDRDHWAFQPIQRPPIPAVKHRRWVGNPIDAFILAKLESHQLPPNPSPIPGVAVITSFVPSTTINPTTASCASNWPAMKCRTAVRKASSLRATIGSASGQLFSRIAFAARWVDADKQVRLALTLATARPPSDTEVRRGAESSRCPSLRRWHQRRRALRLLLFEWVLNISEFVYLD